MDENSELEAFMEKFGDDLHKLRLRQLSGERLDEAERLRLDSLNDELNSLLPKSTRFRPELDSLLTRARELIRKYS